MLNLYCFTILCIGLYLAYITIGTANSMNLSDIFTELKSGLLYMEQHLTTFGLILSFIFCPAIIITIAAICIWRVLRLFRRLVMKD